MISFERWLDKVDYVFIDEDITFQIYLYYIGNADMIVDRWNNPNLDLIQRVELMYESPKCDINKEEVLRVLKEAYMKYESDLKQIHDNTMYVLKNFGRLKIELSLCEDEEVRSRIKYYLAALESAFKSLNKEQQRLIAYKFFEKMTYKDMGNSIGLTHGQVSLRVKATIEIIEGVLFSTWNIEKWELAIDE